MRLTVDVTTTRWTTFKKNKENCLQEVGGRGRPDGEKQLYQICNITVFDIVVIEKQLYQICNITVLKNCNKEFVILLLYYILKDCIVVLYSNILYCITR